MTYKIGDYVVYSDKKWKQLETYENYLSYKGDMYNLMILEEQIEKLKKNNLFIITKVPTLFGTFEATYNGELCKKLKTKDFKLAPSILKKHHQLREVFKNK